MSSPVRRFGLLFLAFYLVFIGGSPYYYQVFAIRVAHHVIMTALLLWWLIARLRADGIPKTPINSAVYALIALWLITSALALDPRIAFESAWFPITHAMLFFVIVDGFMRGRQRLIMETLFMTAALVAIAAFVQVIQWWFGWQPLLGADLPFPPTLPRLDQPFGVSTWLSAFAAPMIIVSIGWALTVRRADYKPPLFALAAALLIVLILAFSRGGFLAFAFGVMLLIVLRLFSRRALNRAVPIVVGVGALTVAIIAVVILISRDASRHAGDTLRADLWSTAVTLIRLDPFTGAGVGMFGRGHRLYRDGTYVDDRLSTAHNLYLNTAAETGIFSLVIIGAGTLAAMRVWVRQWRTAKRDTRKLRLEAAFAALAAFAVQSLFDTFTLTGIVVLPLVLLAYCITPTRFITDAVIRGSKLPAFAFAGLIAAFGVGLWLSDRAHAAFNASVTHQSLRDAQTALSFDPSMRLYQLQVDYLTAAQTDDLPTAIRAYENATALEPTWDTGWINLAVLYSRAGDDAAARSSLERAASISNWNSAAFGWAFLSEITETASQPEITAAYLRSITYPPPNIDWWISTPARRAAYERYTAENPIIPTSGDEYVRRAYAAFPDDPAAAQRFLAIAERLGPFTENIALARVDLAPSPDARRAAMIAIVGSRAISQNFEAVLYQGRRAQFEPLPGLTSPPPTDQDLRVWFELAQSFADEGDPQTARQVYELMIQRHPNLVSDQRARIDAAVRALEEP